MPIFTTQLGKVEHLSPQEAVKQMADYIRSLQDTLEYRLYTLDSSNIAEVDASVTTITIAGEDATKVMEDMNDEVSKLEKTVDGYKTEVGKYSNQVEGYAQQVSTFEQTVEGFETTVADVNGKYSAMEQTVEGFENTVAEVSGKYTAMEQTVEGFEATVKGVDDKYTEVQLTIDGLTVEDESGTTRIKGDSIETESLRVSSANIEGELVAATLKGAEVNLLDANDVICGMLRNILGSLTLVGSTGAMLVLGGSGESPKVTCPGTFVADNVVSTNITRLEERIAALETLLTTAE